jgi:Eukaryotic aspartyl protease
MGMGFQSISSYGASPVFQTFVTQGQTSNPVFAMKLTSSGSELTIGGVNPDLYTGDFTYVPVVKEGYWQIIFDSLNVNGQQVVGSNNAIVDSVGFFISGAYHLDSHALREQPLLLAISRVWLHSTLKSLGLLMPPQPSGLDTSPSPVTAPSRLSPLHSVVKISSSLTL